MVMVESKSVPETSPKLSAKARLTLIQTLNALPSAQFEELLIALNPPNGNIPSNTASQASRSKALFEWLESPMGPGLEILDQLLSRIIAKTIQRSETFVAFVVSGKISNTTIIKVQAFVDLLRKKTGDDSIDVAFFEEGSIKMILSGSPEGLKKLKELVKSGEIEALNRPVIEAVHDIDTTNTDAQKARLVEILKLKSNRFNHSIEALFELDLNLERVLYASSTFDLNCIFDLELNLARSLARSLYLYLALAVISTSTRL